MTANTINDTPSRSSENGIPYTGGLVIEIPSSLDHKQAHDRAGAPTTQQTVDATRKAVDRPDLQTIFFVNLIPACLNAEGSKEVKSVVELIQNWQAWSSSTCEGSVLKEINNKTLSGEPDGQFARNTHRAKVFDYLFGQSTWFALTANADRQEHIEAQKADFHKAIFSAFLTEFEIPATAHTQLEKILTQIGDNIDFSKVRTKDKQQYWLMLTRYDWQDINQKVYPVVHIISFTIDPKISAYTDNKSTYTSVSIDMQWGRLQADFMADMYEILSASFDGSLVTAGMALVKKNSLEVKI